MKRKRGRGPNFSNNFNLNFLIKCKLFFIALDNEFKEKDVQYNPTEFAWQKYFPNLRIKSYAIMNTNNNSGQLKALQSLR